MSRFAVSSIRLLSLQDLPGYFRREKSQAEQAGNIAPVKPLGACDVANSIRLATDDPAEPFMSACECLDEIGVGLGSRLLLI